MLEEEDVTKIVPAVRPVFHAEQSVTGEIADRWTGGQLVLKPGKAGTQEKTVPIESFFRKLTPGREKLGVLEQRINSHPKPADEDRLQLQDYITRIYGSLTTFNVLFADPADRFTGTGGRDGAGPRSRAAPARAARPPIAGLRRRLPGVARGGGPALLVAPRRARHAPEPDPPGVLPPADRDRPAQAQVGLRAAARHPPGRLDRPSTLEHRPGGAGRAVRVRRDARRALLQPGRAGPDVTRQPARLRGDRGRALRSHPRLR